MPPFRIPLLSGVNRLREETGQSLVVFVGFVGVVFCFFALVIDGGAYFAKSREAQNAADAGALAGAQKLRPLVGDGSQCQDDATEVAEDYVSRNLPDGVPTITFLPKKKLEPVSESNPIDKIRVTVDADASLFFAKCCNGDDDPDEPNKPVGKCLTSDAPTTEGQCATASATQDRCTDCTKTVDVPRPLFAFAKEGGSPTTPCERAVRVLGDDNVFKGTLWSNEGFTAPGSGNGGKESLLVTSNSPDCPAPTDIGNDKFGELDRRAPEGWPVEPPEAPKVINSEPPTTANNGSGSSTLSITKPGTTRPRDFMIAQVTIRNNGQNSGGNSTICAPSGWTLVRQD